jgi:deoxyribodipyrimidine photo-lyase
MSRVIHWFRGDLRLRDNTALIHAARTASELALVYVLDPRLLESAATGEPRRRSLHGCLARLAADLEERGHRLIVRRGDPAVEIPRLVESLRADEASAVSVPRERAFLSSASEGTRVDATA